MKRSVIAFTLGITFTVCSLLAWSQFTEHASGQSSRAGWQIKKFDPTDSDGTMNRDTSDPTLQENPDRFVNDFLATLPASCSVQIVPNNFVAPWYIAYACP